MDIIEPYLDYIVNFRIEDGTLVYDYTHSLPIISIALYLLLVHVFPKIWKKGINIDGIMAVWNISLSIMSVACLLGIAIPYIRMCMEKGWWTMFCDAELYSKQPGIHLFFAYVFVLSKYAELLDTLWLVLKKPERPVPFLHWYHHITVLAFTWYSYYFEWSLGFYFSTINATIHSFMYFYYFLTSVHYKPPEGCAFILTFMQTTQMFIGIVLDIVWSIRKFIWKENCACNQPEILMLACAVMYGSYLYLFLKFMFNRYFSGKPKKEAKKKADKKKSQKLD